ncbi:MAG: LacI family DNA-binding transcriptional regulator [Butyrivibrio sp.]|nr:LacI family DNA-binding transcriptional regulator [Butyrivibrio sp.]
MEKEKLNTGKTITIYDIAEEAGVSASTVSRVLNGSASVRKEKKDRILKLIEKYNFKPNALAKGLSDTETKTIGIIVADVRNPYYSALFVACEMAAEKAGYSVGLLNSLNKIERESHSLDLFIQQRVDAIIQMGGRVDDLITDDSYAKKVRSVCGSTPVIVTGKLDKTPVYSVVIDEAAGMNLAMEHLISQGHEKIAMVGGNMGVASTFYKYQRYQENLRIHGIPERGEYVVNSSYDPESGYEAMNKIFELSDIPTAVIAINDFAASGIIRSIREHGLSIPEDISIVSFDNTYIADVTLPKLTSVDYDYKNYGKLLISTAIAAANGKACKTAQMVEPKLVIRESSGPVRKL